MDLLRSGCPIVSPDVAKESTQMSNSDQPAPKFRITRLEDRIVPGAMSWMSCYSAAGGRLQRRVLQRRFRQWRLKQGWLQTVKLKVRAIPFETFEATVEGIAATASKGTGPGLNQNVVLVHCQIRNPDGRLKSGMTGFGRITRGWNSIGMIVASKGLKYLRTEFWW